jgi:GNAT superfamily N-acetyltransferase
VALLQKNLIIEKFKAIRRKDPLYVFRGIKIIATPQEKPIDIYFLDLEKIQREKLEENIQLFKNKSGEDFKLEILSRGNQKYLDQYMEFRKNAEIPYKEPEYLLRNNSRIFLILKDGKIAGTNSLIGQEEMIGPRFAIHFVLDETMVYHFGLFVHTDFRSQGIGTFLQRIAIQYALSNGFKCMFRAVAPWNKYSIDIASHFGFEKIVTVISVDQFFTRRYRFKKEKTVLPVKLKFKLPNQRIVEA